MPPLDLRSTAPRTWSGGRAPSPSRVRSGFCFRVSWWRWEELNLRHGAYETPALPLSYTADPRKFDQLQDGILPRTPPSCPKTCPTRAARRPPRSASRRGAAAATAYFRYIE